MVVGCLGLETIYAIGGELPCILSSSWSEGTPVASGANPFSQAVASRGLAELEHTVQSRMTTPVTDTSATHVSAEALTSIEQALMSELGKVKDESIQTMSRLFDLLEGYSEKKKSLEKQIAGLRSFAQQIEKFLRQSAGEGAPAPNEPPSITRSERERPTASTGPALGTSSSSTRPPSYLQVPKPPSVPAPPLPREDTTPPEDSRVATTHFSTVRSEVRAGAIRIDITNPEQWLAGDTAILRNQEAKQVKLDFQDSNPV